MSAIDQIKTKPQDLEPAEPGKKPGDYTVSIAKCWKMSNTVAVFGADDEHE